MNPQKIPPRWVSTLSAIVLAASTPELAYAHHSPSNYDMAAEIVLFGQVSGYEWANPHVYIFIESLNADGTRERWEIEGAAAAMMRRRGWTAESLAVGDAVAVMGNPGRNGRRILRLIELSTESGVELSNRPLDFDPPGREISSAPSLEGTWVAEGRGRAWLVFTNPEHFPLTTKGRTALQTFDEARDTDASDCVPYSVPMMMLLPDVKSIEILPDLVRIRGELDDTVRTIHMDASSHDGALPTHFGHSIGRWEDDTLVIDTAAYLPRTQGLATGLASSSQKHTVERLTLNADGRSFTYSVTEEDSELLEKAVSGEMIFHYRPDLTFTGRKCDSDSAGRFLESDAGAVGD
jgi:Family of unknown function (DUF6152)